MSHRLDLRIGDTPSACRMYRQHHFGLAQNIIKRLGKMRGGVLRCSCRWRDRIPPPRASGHVPFTLIIRANGWNGRITCHRSSDCGLPC